MYVCVCIPCCLFGHVFFNINSTGNHLSIESYRNFVSTLAQHHLYTCVPQGPGSNATSVK
jgi:hypothetical protein